MSTHIAAAQKNKIKLRDTTPTPSSFVTFTFLPSSFPTWTKFSPNSSKTIQFICLTGILKRISTKNSYQHRPTMRQPCHQVPFVPVCAKLNVGLHMVWLLSLSQKKKDDGDDYDSIYASSLLPAHIFTLLLFQLI